MHIVQTIRIIIIFHAYSHAVVPRTGLIFLSQLIQVHKNELNMFELLCTCSGHNNTMFLTIRMKFTLFNFNNAVMHVLHDYVLLMVIG